MDVTFHRVKNITVHNDYYPKRPGDYGDFHTMIITATDENGVRLVIHLFSDERIEPNYEP